MIAKRMQASLMRNGDHDMLYDRGKACCSSSSYD